MLKLSSVGLGLLLLGLPFTVLCKRQSRRKDEERYRKRIEAAASSEDPLTKALSKLVKSMNFEEALLAKKHYQKENDREMVIKCGERLLALGGNADVLQKTQLELAELFLERKKYTDAEKHAQSYLTYYPGAHDSKKAALIAIQATFHSQACSERDQKKTRDTIQLAQDYLENYPKDTENKDKILELLNKSYLKLVRSEMQIIETHLNTFNYSGKKQYLDAALKRFNLMKKNLVPHAPQTKKKVLELEVTLAKAADDKERSTNAQQELTKMSAPKLVLAKQDEAPFWSRVKHHPLRNYFNENNENYFA